MKLLSSFFFIVLLALQANAQSLQRVAPEQVGMDSRHLLYADEAIETAIANKDLSLIHISEPTRQAEISYAVFCLKKKKKNKKITKKKKTK